jgi:Dullard-like phosphatase family protein
MDLRTFQSKGSSLSKKTTGATLSGPQNTLKRFQNLISGSKAVPTNKQSSPIAQTNTRVKTNEVSMWMNNKENRRPTGSLTKSITPTAKSSGSFQKFSHFLSPLLVAKTINSSLQKKLKTAGVKNSFENHLKILEAKTNNEYSSAVKSNQNLGSHVNGISFRNEDSRPKLSSARLSPEPKGQPSPFQISINFKTNSRDKRKSNFIQPVFKQLATVESGKTSKGDKKNSLRSNSKEEFNLYNKRTQQPIKGHSPSLKNITFSNFLNSVKDSTKTIQVPGLFSRKVIEELSLPDLFKQYSLFMQLHDTLSASESITDCLHETYSECFQPKGLICPQKHLNPKAESFPQLRLALRIQRAVLAVVCASKDLISSLSSLTRELMAKICLGQYYVLLLLKKYQKAQGESESAKYIASFLKLPSFKLRFSPPMDIPSSISDLNSQLSADLEKFLECFSHNLRRQQLSIMIKTALNLKKSEADLTSQISELFIENKPALLSSQSALSQSEQAGLRDSKGHTETSLYGDDEDPYFILQPLRTECFLPGKQQDDKSYTLVLDLDETLVHFEESADGGQFLVRPYAQEFLSKMKDHFEVVIFTAAVKDYADWILDRIDLTKAVSHRLYRNHTSLQNGVYMKDLSKLGRDLSRTIIIDNNAENFQLQPDNGIYIKTWHDDPHDIALKQLAKLLVRVLDEGEEDIRIALRKTQQKLAQRNRGTN